MLAMCQEFLSFVSINYKTFKIFYKTVELSLAIIDVPLTDGEVGCIFRCDFCFNGKYAL